jgi:hypothetical protein
LRPDIVITRLHALNHDINSLNTGAHL